MRDRIVGGQMVINLTQPSNILESRHPHQDIPVVVTHREALSR